MHRVFVYGTLKHGLPNHPLIQASRFLGPAITTERYRMIADVFPVLISDRSGLTVKGELYEVSTETRNRLDRLEGFHGVDDPQNSYDRHTTDVHYWDGARLMASLAELYVGARSRWQDAIWPQWRITNSTGQLEWPRATS
jgi:gamma-glutamylcyclotransferase (GGCT)/AIG2-like uncharacterized protein YtfP